MLIASRERPTVRWHSLAIDCRWWLFFSVYLSRLAHPTASVLDAGRLHTEGAAWRAIETSPQRAEHTAFATVRRAAAWPLTRGRLLNCRRWDYPMTVPSGMDPASAQENSAASFLPRGVPALHSRWGTADCPFSTCDFGGFTSTTLNAYH